MRDLPENISRAFDKLAESGRKVGDAPLVVGGFVRDWIAGIPLEDINDVDVISEFGKINELLIDLTKRYGLGQPYQYEYSGTYSLMIDNFLFEFQSPENPHVHFPIEEELAKMGIENTYLNKNIYERDFTVNTLCYDVIEKEFLDITGYGIDDLLYNKIIRTTIDPQKAISFNPLITLRIFRLMTEFELEPEPELEKLIPYGVELIPEACKQRSEIFVRNVIADIFSYDYDKADKLFKKYGLYNKNIPIPKDIFDRAVKRDMGIKYISVANNDCLYDSSNDILTIIHDDDEIRASSSLQNKIKIAVSSLYLQSVIDKNTQILSLNNKIGTIEHIAKMHASEMTNNYKIAYNNTHMYERIKRRKEYRQRKRREERRDRIEKIKFWKNFQNKIK